MQPAIRVKNLGKRYHVASGEGTRSKYRTLREALVETAAVSLRRLRGGSATAGPPEEFWALRDVSFEVQPGEVVGIIGRNGAGKSTLLKILSQITKPTTGRVEINGRVGSLLEVGTGFHPELTGRENVYLNGSILGMSRKEINRKFDEIVAFAEVEKFLDLPVKRYSSGMYVRLAFAVAAHLEPEILIVDEVLAVGDMAFQKKCLGKMEDVARAGRTVLFVSHNMHAVTQLTSSVVILDRGSAAFQGSTAEGIAKYTAEVFTETALGEPFRAHPDPSGIHLVFARVITSEQYGEQICTRPIVFEFDIHVGERREGICFSFQVLGEDGRPVCHFWHTDCGVEMSRSAGVYRLRCVVPRCRLYQGRYSLKTYLSDRRAGELLESLTDICAFEVTMRGIVREEFEWQPNTMVYWEDAKWDNVVKCN
jgi:lipopolysaccharide transport system ATP-binding protein